MKMRDRKKPKDARPHELNPAVVAEMIKDGTFVPEKGAEPLMILVDANGKPIPPSKNIDPARELELRAMVRGLRSKK